jgi:hypothetical protein
MVPTEKGDGKKGCIYFLGCRVTKEGVGPRQLIENIKQTSLFLAK